MGSKSRGVLTLADERFVAFPRDSVYRWWTDFREDDHLAATSPRKAVRRVVRRDRNELWLRDRAAYLPVSIVAHVTLRPPDGYDVEAWYPGADVRYAYRLVPVGGGTRVTFVGEIRPRHLGRIVVPLAVSWIRRYAQRDLDFHLREMTKDLADSDQSESPGAIR